MALITFSQCLVATVSLLILRAIYRITLHPLAGFPGPRLAALTNLYAVWYDMLSDDSLVKHLQSLHDTYGPIVRVRPTELHVFDWDAYHTVFKQGHIFHKPHEFYNVPHVEGCFLNTSDGRQAKPHRDLFVQSFSKATIDRTIPLIHEKLATFLDRMREFALSDKRLALDSAFNCMTADVTMHACYQMDLGLLQHPEFRPDMVTSVEEFAPIVPFFWYFPNIGNALNKLLFRALPDTVVKPLFPGVSLTKGLMRRCDELISSLAQAPPNSELVTSSIFRTALNPNLNKSQYLASSKELSADAVLIFLAGTDTTAHALTCAMWGMMKKPEIYANLRKEIEQVLPEKDSLGLLRDLEHLPLLRAVIKESLRFSMGTSSRLPRIVPNQGATLCGKHIPAKTRVSFSHYVYNNDARIFPDPHSFKPERWLSGNTDQLEKHMISFSRGSRSCIGINLAYAEMHTILAHLVRRFDFVNDGTTDRDMDWFDAFSPRIRGHLKVKVRAL